MKPVIGVIGPAKSEYPKNLELVVRLEKETEEVGRLLAKSGAFVLTGGMDGVMEIACKGAKLGGGTTIGTPGRTRGLSNKYVDIEILTPIDTGDFLFAGNWTSDSMIVFPGGAGTLAELCLGYRLGKTMIIMEGYDPYYEKLVGNFMDNGEIVRLLGASTPEKAVEIALEAARQNIKKPGEL